MWIKNNDFIVNLENYDGVKVNELDDSKYEVYVYKHNVDISARCEHYSKIRMGVYKKEVALKIIPELEEHLCNGSSVYEMPKSL